MPVNPFIFVIGSSVEPDGKGDWKTNERDSVGVVNSSWRIHAAAALHHERNCPLIVSAGTVESPAGNIIYVSSVMRTELINLGVAPRSIIEAPAAKNTLENLINCVDAVSRHDRYSHKIPSVAILSSEWHLPRIQLMLERPVRQKINQDVFERVFKGYELIGAESVLVRKDPDRWGEIISEARSSNDVLDRVNMEAQGIRDLMNGVYEFNRTN